MCTAGVLLVELLGPVLIRSLWHLKQQVDYIITEGGELNFYSGYLESQQIYPSTVVPHPHQ